MPANGPGKSATVSAIAGSPNAAKRAGSPLALRMSPSHCGSSRAITHSKMVRPPIFRIGLSPPPIRRAKPPASSTPGISIVMAFAFPLMPRGFFFDESKILVVNDALFARQRNETLSAGASDQCQSDLSRQINAPGREARARDQDQNPHPYRLDHHLGGQPSRV